MSHVRMASGRDRRGLAEWIALLVTLPQQVKLAIQARQILRSRDLLRETLDALPVGVELYDRNEHLTIFNKAAAAMSGGLLNADSIGKTFSELADQFEARDRALGVAEPMLAEARVARFRSKGHVHIRQSGDGRWIERLELPTANGGTIGLRRDVTELKNRELEIAHGRDVLQETIDALPAGVTLYDVNERLMMFNAEAHTLNPRIQVGKTYGELVAEMGEDAEAAGIRSRRYERELRRFRSKVERDVVQMADGRWFEWSEKPTPSGRTVGLRINVTDLKHREQDLERSRAEYQSLVDSLTDAVYAMDDRGRLSFASAASAELFGKPVAELLGTPLADYVVPDDRERLKQAAGDLLGSPDDAVRQIELRIKRADGELRHVEVRYRKPVAGDRVAGDRIVQVGVMRDVTERVLLLGRLEQEMSRWRSIVESSGALIMMVDRDLKIVMANREFWKSTGLDPDKTVGRTFLDVLTSGIDPVVLKRWLDGPLSVEETKPVRYSKRRPDAEGRERFINITAKPIVDDDRVMRQIMFLGVDDTERREAERVLVETERLTTLGEMAATVAHEIAQPLQVIDLSGATALDEINEARTQGKVPDIDFIVSKLERTSDQVEKASRIMSELRAFVRSTSSDVAVRFDPAHALRAAVDLTRHSMQLSRIQVSIRTDGELPQVTGHVGKFEQVLVNLLNNARDEGATVIELSAGAIRRDGRDLLRVAIEDNGPGIAPHVLPKLFNAFITTKPRGKGTGLGLRICRRIVEEMRGQISAANRAQGGACFEILLPPAA